MSADKLDAMSIRTNLAGSVRVLWWEVPEIQEMGFNIASKDELDYALGPRARMIVPNQPSSFYGMQQD